MLLALGASQRRPRRRENEHTDQKMLAHAVPPLSTRRMPHQWLHAHGCFVPVRPHSRGRTWDKRPRGGSRPQYNVTPGLPSSTTNDRSVYPVPLGFSTLVTKRRSSSILCDVTMALKYPRLSPS